MNIKKEQKYKIIRSEIPIDETNPIIKKEKPEIINLTEIKELFKKPDYALLSKNKLKKKLEEENKALKTKDIDDFYDKLEINQLTKIQKMDTNNGIPIKTGLAKSPWSSKYWKTSSKLY